MILFLRKRNIYKKATKNQKDQKFKNSKRDLTLKAQAG